MSLLSQLSRLLPLPEEELQQILDYASSLSKDGAAEHLSNLLGDSPQAVSFIASFNGRRHSPLAAEPQQEQRQQQQQQQQGAQQGQPSSAAAAAQPEPVPKASRLKKKKAPLHMPHPRKVENLGPTPGTAYTKKSLDLEYLPASKRSSPGPSSGNTSKANTPPPPPASKGQAQKQSQQQQGFLISDGPPAKGKPKSNTTSRSSTPKPNNATTKVSITGGTAMAGASGAIADLDAAIRALELTTNPTLDADASARRCNCVATRHPLQTAAPNCLSCGKVVCVKEGLGPCTFCGTPLLSTAETQDIIKELKAERGRERMAADREANRRPDVGRTPAPFTKPRDGFGAGGASLSEAEIKAREHRDKLLSFQAQNARRTTVRDEAADFDFTAAMSGGGGTNMWSSPEERALELKRQQKLLRELEWNAKPDYEKRRQVVSIDLVGGRVVKKMVAVERPVTPPQEDFQGTDATDGVLSESNGNKGSASQGQGGGAFSKNPLLGAMIKPVYDSKGKGREVVRDGTPRTKWRRVQDDLDDNEAVILDGGVYGHGGASDDRNAGDEPACG